MLRSHSPKPREAMDISMRRGKSRVGSNTWLWHELFVVLSLRAVEPFWTFLGMNHSQSEQRTTSLRGLLRQLPIRIEEQAGSNGLLDSKPADRAALLEDVLAQISEELDTETANHVSTLGNLYVDSSRLVPWADILEAWARGTLPDPSVSSSSLDTLRRRVRTNFQALPAVPDN